MAVVVDDEAMGVTHVLRGQEHLNNTPKHVCLQRALGYATPAYAHLPVIFNPEGSKMSKRVKDTAARALLRDALEREPERARSLADAAMPWPRVEAWLDDKKAQLDTAELRALAAGLELELPGIDVEDFRRGGYLPEVLVNFLALLGWSPGEKLEDGRDRERFESDYLAERFSTERVGKGNARFDRTKLLAFNQETIAGLPEEAFLERWWAWCREFDPDAAAHLDGDPERRRLFAAALQPRSRTLADPTAPGNTGRFALVDDDAYAFDEKAVAKVLRKGEPSGWDRLDELQAIVAAVEPFDPEAIEAAIAARAEADGVGMGKLAQPLRVAVTGTSASPPLGATLAILGREAVLRRIERCRAECSPG